MQFIRIAILASILASASAFVQPKSLCARPSMRSASAVQRQRSATVSMMGPLDLIQEPASQYADIWIPTLLSFNLPAVVLKYLHPVNMAVVLFAMGGYGSYLGWKIRTEPEAEFVDAVTGKTARDLHPQLMAAATFFFLLGGQGGFVLTQAQGVEIFQSPHAYTAVAGMGLLFAQGALGVFGKGSESARSVHAYLGTATMAVLLVHAGLGMANLANFN